MYAAPVVPPYARCHVAQSPSERSDWPAGGRGPTRITAAHNGSSHASPTTDSLGTHSRTLASTTRRNASSRKKSGDAIAGRGDGVDVGRAADAALAALSLSTGFA